MGSWISELRKPIFRALIFVAAVVVATEAFRWGESQFRYENIAYDPQFFAVSADEQEPPPGLQAILSQPYSYLGRGKQSFAFVSKDGRYVLKFFDRSRLRLWSDKKSAEDRIHQAVRGYAVADKYDRDHVGLIYLHFMPTVHRLPRVMLTDRFGFTHKIDLDDVPFIVQKKAEPTRVVISKYLDEGNEAAAKGAFLALFGMYADEHTRGVYDADHNVMYNTGFVDGVPIRIDAGRLVIDDTFKDIHNSREEIDTIKKERVDAWLQRHYTAVRLGD